MINHLKCTICLVVVSLTALMLLVKFSFLGAINMNDAIKRLKWGKLILLKCTSQPVTLLCALGSRSSPLDPILCCVHYSSQMDALCN